MNLRLAVKASTLAALAMVAAVPSFARAQSAELAHDMFERADLNNDGRLSRVEFQAARETLFRRLDINDDARLTAAEMREAGSDLGVRPPRQPGRDQVQRLRAVDRNNDRAVDIHEYCLVSAERFALADQNRDGFISRSEIAGFVRAMGLGG